jgi:hypothetical protein
MIAKLKSWEQTLGNNLLSVALLLCGIELSATLVALAIGLLLGHPSEFVIRANAISWLLCGFGSVALAICALIAGPKRGTAAGILLVSLATFVLCGARFAIV